MGKRACMIIMAVLFGLLFASAGFAQAPTAVIKVEALSPQEIHDLGWMSPRSSGLRVIGKGELIYLSGHNAGDEDVTSYTWSFAALPPGSNATLDSTDKAWTTFHPDTTGQFVVQLTIQTASGADDTTITITSAKFVGIGNIGGATPGFGQCALGCHAEKVSSWEETGHATMFTEAIDGLKSSHYNEGCIECHTVGFNEDAEAVNGGFDDVAHDLGWVFPDTLKDGNWADILADFAALAQKSNIQCENCHGPGSLHNGDKTKIDVSLDEGVCGFCHEEAPYHRRNTMWKNSRHAVGVAFAAGRQECARCHSGWGFVDFVDGKPQEQLRTGFPQVSCAVCHDPHSPQNPKQLRKLEDVTLNNGVTVTFGGEGRFCMSCHISRRNAETYVQDFHQHFGPHHSNQTDMIAGTNAITFGLPIPSSNHKGVVENLCVTCHMAPTPAAGEPGRDRVGDHTFAMHAVDDMGTPDDPSDDVEVDNVAACKSCHGNVTSFDDFMAKEDYDRDGTIEPVQAEVDGLLDAVGVLLPPLGDPNVEVTPDYTPLQLRAAYNHAFVSDDGSHGIHNLQFAINLLRAAHRALTTGEIGAGMITGIMDVPNDQGKQVRITWERFGGDGVSNNPVKHYSLWRRVDDAAPGMGKKSQPVAIYESFENVPANVDEIAPGAKLQIDGKLWDFAGSVPAAGLDMYSAIAPTLFDSTKTDGMHWSVFVVSAHTEVPAIYAISPPDSGYSMDNLAPGVPMHVAAKETEMGVELTWDEPVDPDVKYTAVYRSTSPGFDPAGMEPIAELTEQKYLDADVQVGATYYYRVSHFDFAGNQGAFSPEVNLVVTAVPTESPEAIPTDYVLQQNYPNPFNPSTIIRFGLPEASEVHLTIYNMLGAPVRTLAAGKFAAGMHTLSWDGRDDSGRLVSTGTYLYRLQANSVTMIKKMVFVQ